MYGVFSHLLQIDGKTVIESWQNVLLSTHCSCRFCKLIAITTVTIAVNSTTGIIPELTCYEQTTLFRNLNVYWALNAELTQTLNHNRAHKTIFFLGYLIKLGLDVVESVDHLVSITTMSPRAHISPTGKCSLDWKPNHIIMVNIFDPV